MFEDAETLLKMLAAGRIDIAVCDKIVAQTLIKKMGIAGELKALEKPLFKAGLHVAAGKENPKARGIVEAFNKGIEKIKETGEFRKLLVSYGKTLILSL